MKIKDVISVIRDSKTGVRAIKLKDASRYAANAKGELTCNGTLYTRKYAIRHKGDEVILTGNKETNLTEVERTLRSLVGKGDAIVWLTNGAIMNGEVEE